MLNPANASFGLVGVYSPDISELMGESLMRLGMQHALVVHSCGLDELTPMGPAGAAAAAGTAAASTGSCLWLLISCSSQQLCVWQQSCAGVVDSQLLDVAGTCVSP